MKKSSNRSATDLSADPRLDEPPPGVHYKAQSDAHNLAETGDQPIPDGLKKKDQTDSEKLALVARFTDELVIITDADGLTEWVNPAMLRRSGFSFEEMIGKKPGALFQGPDTDPQAVARIRDAIRAGRSIREQMLNYSKTQEPYWVDLQISPVLGDDGRISRFVAIQRDITELHRTREQLIAAREMAEEASRMKSLFLATVSHELRTPLNGLLGMTELLLETPMEELQREYVLTIQQSGKLLLNVVGEILDVSRIAGGMIELSPRPFALRPVVEDVCKILSNEVRRHGLTFEYRIGKDVSSCIEADPDRLRQILVNLIENGVKFTKTGGVLLEIEVQRNDATPPALVFRVSDSGIGIRADDLPRLFKPFGQLDPSRSREQEGLGLGLSICRSLIDRMNGRIWVESLPGMGSVFSFSIPYLPRPESAISPIPIPPPSSKVQKVLPKVLLVEDNPINRKVASTLIEKLGFECDIACDGQEAVDATRQNSYRIILMDIHMPRMDGLEATRIIRSRTSSDLQPYVVAVTADASVEHRQLYLAAGIDEVLAKPISLALLRKTMAAALRHLAGRIPSGAKA
jgi:PAS domain S-box-containing protein